MNVVFMGTPDFAVPILQALLTRHTVRGVVTQPDRPVGRGQALRFSPVKSLALEAGVPVLQPETLRSAAVRRALSTYEADVFVVAAYGMLLSPKILALPPLGCVNVHASLLPRYRGAAPMQYALLNGDDVTGITIMYMAKGLDTGDIILQKALPISAEEHFPALHDRMAALGGVCILEALEQIEAGTAQRTPQDEAAATYAPSLRKTDGHIDWSCSSERIVNMTRGLDPWPGAYALHEEQVLKIWACEKAIMEPELKSEPESESEPKSKSDSAVNTQTTAMSTPPPPGTVLAVDGTRGIMIQTGDGAVWVTEVQAVGRRRMRATDYLRGHAVASGTLLA